MSAPRIYTEDELAAMSPARRAYHEDEARKYIAQVAAGAAVGMAWFSAPKIRPDMQAPLAVIVLISGLGVIGAGAALF